MRAKRAAVGEGVRGLEGRGAVLRALRRAHRRAVTLVEVLIVVAIIAIITGATVSGMGAVDAARMKGSAMMIASAVHVAYAHANATSKVVRLVFDMNTRMVTLEETSGQMLIAKNDVAGGAEAATAAEKAALEEGEQFMKGPRPVRPRFTPAKALGFGDKKKPGKELSSGIRFFQIETAHDDQPTKEGRAYLYFWPGGLTERAAIQIMKGGPSADPRDEDVITIVVSPLTGKTKILRGRVAMPRPRDDVEESERQDSTVF